MVSSTALPTCWTGNNSPGQGNLFFQLCTKLCQITLTSFAKISTGNTIAEQWCDASVLAGSSLWILQLALWWWASHSPDYQVILPSSQALSSEARSNCWNLLQFKQKHSNLALSDLEYCCASNSGPWKKKLKFITACSPSQIFSQ